MVGVPAKQTGWASAFGERLDLSPPPPKKRGNKEVTCPHTGDRYLLEGKVVKRVIG